MIAHSKKIGDVEVTALSDGVLATSLDVVLGIDRAEVRRLAGATDGDGVHIAVNAFLLKLAGKWALIDAGAGNSMGPTLGKLPEHLGAFGVAPEEIAAVFLTHIHPDHSNGLVDDAGRAVFANAELILHEAEARSIATRRAGRPSASAATSPRRRLRPRPIVRACVSCARARRCPASRPLRCPATRRAIPDG
jgi:glyoxylase-like metal-dependent hydrolase (beta-lactamase superfamily II)